MKFNSLDFLLLLASTLILFFGLRPRARIFLLPIASLIFYSFWSFPLISLIVISGTIDYTSGLLLQRTDVVWKRRALLLMSLTANLGFLCYFKYANFFLDSIHAVMGDSREAKYLDILLPPGISFYTFQSMSYAIDIYRRQLSPTKSYIKFFAYITFFPQLVAGPIERAGHLMTQLEHACASRFSPSNFLTGMRMIVWGMFKKVVLADYSAMLANSVFGNPAGHNGWETLVGVLAFTIQIYCDFSAYSEIARGSARMFGVDLMVNFNQPYLATDIGDFWRRWHISLSTWIRDYIFIPLGGSRVSKPRLIFNIFITMFLSGLWHGAAWNFILWGLFHGALLVTSAIVTKQRFWVAFRNLTGTAGLLFSWLITQICVAAGWILFRVSKLSDVTVMLRQMGHSVASLTVPSTAQSAFLGFIALFLIGSYLSRQYSVFDRIDRRSGLSVAFCAVLTAVILLLTRPDGPQFIYFQF